MDEEERVRQLEGAERDGKQGMVNLVHCLLLKAVKPICSSYSPSLVFKKELLS